MEKGSIQCSEAYRFVRCLRSEYLVGHGCQMSRSDGCTMFARKLTIRDQSVRTCFFRYEQTWILHVGFRIPDLLSLDRKFEWGDRYRVPDGVGFVLTIRKVQCKCLQFEVQ
ncbi:hypothetical protein M758_9G064100 [Ceratodon purpureus]|nr:hypothetical protein M758_9G064100 [Ceratodon purpureus]